MSTTQNLLPSPMFKLCTILVSKDTFLGFLSDHGATSQNESGNTIVLFNKHNVSEGTSYF